MRSAITTLVGARALLTALLVADSPDSYATTSVLDSPAGVVPSG